MVKVAGLWELGYNTPLVENDLWIYPARDYGVDEFYMTPVSGIRSDHVTEVHDLGELLDTQRAAGVQVVLIDERGTIELDDFHHPESAIYVFGKASTSALGYQRPGDVTVKIVTPKNLATLWPHQAMVLVLHDRMKKGR